jgi:hypothetical protein
VSNRRICRGTVNGQRWAETGFRPSPPRNHHYSHHYPYIRDEADFRKTDRCHLNRCDVAKESLCT